MQRSLAQTQHWFLRKLTQPDGSSEQGSDSRSRALGERDELDEVVRHPATETRAERLEIYRHSYFARLEECLADDYPALKVALGSDAFSQLCREYATTHPSTGPNLNSFGRGMPTFIRQSRPSCVFESELAGLEWTLVEVLHAPAPRSQLESELARVDQQKLAALRFVPSRAARLLVTEYPVNAYFQAFVKGKAKVMPDPERSWLAVVRNDYKIWRLDLEGDEASVLQRLFEGQPLGEALAGVAAEATEVQRWFKRWASSGIFTNVALDSAEA